jgi:hypothetical protein
VSAAKAFKAAAPPAASQVESERRDVARAPDDIFFVPRPCAVAVQRPLDAQRNAKAERASDHSERLDMPARSSLTVPAS